MPVVVTAVVADQAVPVEQADPVAREVHPEEKAKMADPAHGDHTAIRE
jgi:hypothetical protein